MYDVATDEEEIQERCMSLKMSASGRLADNLKPNAVELSVQVKIVWLVE